jgi:hypothetical protein
MACSGFIASDPVHPWAIISSAARNRSICRSTGSSSAILAVARRAAKRDRDGNLRRRQPFRADDAECKKLGANPGTDAYVECRLAIDVQRANAELGGELARPQTRAKQLRVTE